MDDKNVENKPMCCAGGKVPVFGMILIALGVIFLFEKVFSFNFFAWLRWDYVWPVILIAWGMSIVLKKSKK